MSAAPQPRISPSPPSPRCMIPACRTRRASTIRPTRKMPAASASSPIENRKSHTIVEQGLSILKNLAHRGAVGADPMMGDGCGILVQIPHRFFAEECAKIGITLPEPGHYGIGHLFMPRDPSEFRAVEEISTKPSLTRASSCSAGATYRWTTATWDRASRRRARRRFDGSPVFKPDEGGVEPWLNPERCRRNTRDRLKRPGSGANWRRNCILPGTGPERPRAARVSPKRSRQSFRFGSGPEQSQECIHILQSATAAGGHQHASAGLSAAGSRAPAKPCTSDNTLRPVIVAGVCRTPPVPYVAANDPIHEPVLLDVGSSH